MDFDAWSRLLIEAFGLYDSMLKSGPRRVPPLMAVRWSLRCCSRAAMG